MSDLNQVWEAAPFEMAWAQLTEEGWIQGFDKEINGKIMRFQLNPTSGNHKCIGVSPMDRASKPQK